MRVSPGSFTRNAVTLGPLHSQHVKVYILPIRKLGCCWEQGDSTLSKSKRDPGGLEERETKGKFEVSCGNGCGKRVMFYFPPPNLRKCLVMI